MLSFTSKISATVVLFVICLISSASCSGFGRCPHYPSMPKFNITKFLGKWHEVERSFYLPEIATGCATFTFDEVGRNDDSQPVLEFGLKTVNLWTMQPSVSITTATLENEKSSIMHIQSQSRLPPPLAQLLPGSGRYQILYTDYDNFGILWSCTYLGFSYIDHIWLLGRNTDYEIDIRSKIYDSLAQLGLDSDRLIVTKNKNCPTTL